MKRKYYRFGLKGAFNTYSIFNRFKVDNQDNNIYPMLPVKLDIGPLYFQIIATWFSNERFGSHLVYEQAERRTHMIRNTLGKFLDSVEISVLEASRRTGLHRSVIGRFVRNEAGTIGLETLDAICRGLNVDISEVLEYVPDEQMTPEDIAEVEHRQKYIKKATQRAYKYQQKDE